MPYKVPIIRRAFEGRGKFANNKLVISPRPDGVDDVSSDGSVSIDLRLGRWFLVLREMHHHILPMVEDDEQILRENGEIEKREAELVQRHFVRFGQKFILHPGRFVLGATLEWVRIPTCSSGSVVGKSALGRRGLIIETAPTVHPGFTGCLTLEMTNVGQVPLPLMPGMSVCQLLIEDAKGQGQSTGTFHGLRRPVLGRLRLDNVARALRAPDI
jgi:dCTP deaminase